MKKIIYFNKIEESKPKSEYTNMINDIFGKSLDVYAVNGSIYVLNDSKLKNINSNVSEIMELEMNEIIFKHISLKEPDEVPNPVEKVPIFEKSETESDIKNNFNPIDSVNGENSEKKDDVSEEIINTELLFQETIDFSEKTIEKKKPAKIKKTKIEKEPLPEDVVTTDFNEKKENKFGIKEFFAVLFTLVFIGVNVYLWMLLKSKN